MHSGAGLVVLAGRGESHYLPPGTDQAASRVARGRLTPPATCGSIRCGQDDDLLDPRIAGPRSGGPGRRLNTGLLRLGVQHPIAGAVHPPPGHRIGGRRQQFPGPDPDNRRQGPETALDDTRLDRNAPSAYRRAVPRIPRATPPTTRQRRLAGERRRCPRVSPAAVMILRQPAGMHPGCAPARTPPPPTAARPSTAGSLGRAKKRHERGRISDAAGHRAKAMARPRRPRNLHVSGGDAARRGRAV